MALVVFLFAFPFMLTSVRLETPAVTQCHSSLASNTVTDPFNITENSDFMLHSEYGSGTQMNPYVIENLNVSSPGLCIRIVNTSAHFIIRGCVFDSENTEYGFGAITMENVANGRIESNLFRSGLFGIAAHQCRDSEFSSNVFNVDRICFLSTASSDCRVTGNIQGPVDTTYPIHIQDAARFSIISNQFGLVMSEGMRLTGSTDCTLDNNSVEISPSSTYSLYGYTLRECHNCDLTGSFARGFSIGVEVRDGTGNEIVGNSFIACTRGVRDVSNSTRIESNEVFSYFDGIDVQSSCSARVIRNTIRTSLADSSGIAINGGFDVRVERNNITRSGTGIRLQGTAESTITQNRIMNCTTGISIEEAQTTDVPAGPPVDCVIDANTLVGCSFRFDLWSPIGFNQVITGNTVNGAEVGYVYNRTGEVIDGSQYGQLTLAVCEDVQVRGAVYAGQSAALSILFCADVEISDADLRSNDVGVHVRSSSQTTLNSVHASSNNIGIHLEGVTGTYVYRCRIQGNGYGLFMEDALDSSVYGCEAFENYLSAVVIGSHSSVLESNYFHHNEYGLHLLRTNYAFVIGNTISHNAYTGVLLNRASDGNTIYGNSIGWNGINAICTGTDNQWDDGISHGNLWSDLGTNEQYEIDIDDVDRYPQALTSNSSTTTTGTEATNEYSPLDDPLFTLMVAVSSCGVAFCVLRTVRTRP